jgi:hypothetical protein
MQGYVVTYARKSLGLTHKSFAKMLSTDVDHLKSWEVKGLRSPHDTEGPTSRIIQILISEKLSVKVKKDSLKLFGYQGPEKKYSDIGLLKYIKAGDWK